MILLPLSLPPGARPGITMGALARLAAAIAAASVEPLLPRAAALADVARDPLVRRPPRPRPRKPRFLGLDLMISSRAVNEKE